MRIEGIVNIENKARTVPFVMPAAVMTIPILVLIQVFCSASTPLQRVIEPAKGPQGRTSPVQVETMYALFGSDPSAQQEAVEILHSHWDLALAPMILEILYLIDFDQPGSRSRLWRLLEEQTGKKHDRDVFTWFQWLWNQDYPMHPDYPQFKAEMYSGIDPRFRWWFYSGMKHRIRLDEIVWGGVRVDGIPPLEHPKFVTAEEADYLGDQNIVFGIYVNGEARAYPKRILAWHELFNDTVGGVDVTCAYCTLCGSAVLYRQRIGDRQFDFGTSGFLYRSNKLMYDRQTDSLWSALEGVPVTGELVGSGLQLERLPIVTTTWAEWQKRHPETRVLSLETGHRRDYGEGVAYRDYFATDELMFPVPLKDQRLKNKQEVLALHLEDEPVAYSTQFLKKRPIYHDQIGGRSIVILTDRSGANRVYDAEGITFERWQGEAEVSDRAGKIWKVEEDGLVSPAGKVLSRIPAHRAFWFGWYAQFPETRLVQ